MMKSDKPTNQPTNGADDTYVRQKFSCCYAKLWNRAYFSFSNGNNHKIHYRARAIIPTYSQCNSMVLNFISDSNQMLFKSHIYLLDIFWAVL